MRFSKIFNFSRKKSCEIIYLAVIFTVDLASSGNAKILEIISNLSTFNFQMLKQASIIVKPQ